MQVNPSIEQTLVEQTSVQLFFMSCMKAHEKIIQINVKGNSMEPAFNDGDILCVEFVHASRFGTGDIIVFQQHGQLIAHRLLKTRLNCNNKTRQYFQKGDNRPGGAWVTEDRMVGRVTRVLPKSGLPIVLTSRIARRINRWRAFLGRVTILCQTWRNRIKKSIHG
jgi:signal peptidase I